MAAVQRTVYLYVMIFIDISQYFLRNNCFNREILRRQTITGMNYSYFFNL
jgi:hypothetical protein